MKYRLLGQFTYCGQTIVLSSREDETEFEVASQGTRNGATIRLYPSLGPAKDKFEMLVHELMSYCSGSDLSLYMRQDAPEWPASA